MKVNYLKSSLWFALGYGLIVGVAADAAARERV